MKYLIGLTAVFAVALIASAGFSADRMTASDREGSGYAIIKVINQDQFEGKWKQFKGDLKKKWGKFTDDDLLQIEGNYDKFQGKMQERYGDRREEVKRWTDEWFASHDEMGRPRKN